MKIHSSLQAYSASASSEATGYPATNLAISQVGRPWRSTALTAQTLTLDLGASVTPASVLIQEANWTTATVDSSPDNINWTARGTLTNYKDISGRYKGLLELIGTYRYLRLSLPVQTMLDANAYFMIGAAYVFLLAEVAAIAPEWNLVDEVICSEDVITLSNRRKIDFKNGWDFITLNGTTMNRPSDDAARVIRLAKASTIGIDLQLINNREKVWPMRSYVSKYAQSLDGPSLWEMEFNLEEIV